MEIFLMGIGALAVLAGFIRLTGLRRVSVEFQDAKAIGNSQIVKSSEP